MQPPAHPAGSGTDNGDDALRPTLRVEPRAGLADGPLRIAATGLPPLSPVRLICSAVDGVGVAWRSVTLFQAGPDGAMDTTQQAPTGGSYRGIDPLGPLWSMLPADSSRGRFFGYRGAAPVRFTVRALTMRGVLSDTGQRVFAGPGVVSCPVHTPRLDGSLWYPAGGGPHPGVLLLGGLGPTGVHGPNGNGGLDHVAALLAGRGFAVLSLDNAGTAGSAGELVDRELEHFTAAVRWLAAHRQVSGRRIAVAGSARGAELALQLGVECPTVGAVVAASPTHVRRAGQSADATDLAHPAWLLHGAALPFVPGRRSVGDGVRFLLDWAADRPMRQRGLAIKALKNDAAVQAATIPVERIDGPVLMLYGTEDQFWPSSLAAVLIAERRRSVGADLTDQSIQLRGAGHFVGFPAVLPGLPPMTELMVGHRAMVDYGGSPAANAAAAAIAWTQAIAFLRSADLS